MRIHQITHLFYPDEIAGASLYTDLALFLRDCGHDVRVSTTFSYYPALSYRPEDSNLRSREELFQGIPVRRIAMWLPKKHKGLRRFIPELTYLWALLRRARWLDWSPDVIIAASPMLAQCLALRWLYPSATPRVLVVQDLMATAAVDLGIIRGPGFGRLLSQIESYALSHADQLITIHPKMLQRLGGTQARARVIPNWIHRRLLNEIRNGSPEKRARTKLVYSGNLGVKQGLPAVIKMIGLIGAPWTLEIFGGGAESEKVAQQIDRFPNVRLHPLQEQSAYIFSLKTAAACLVTQSAAGGASFLPSKLLPALATGTPILAICEKDTPLAEEVLSGKFGEVVPPDDAEALKATLIRWANCPQLLQGFSAAALAHANRFDPEIILPEYESMLRALVEEAVKQRKGGICI
jgi:colanic acid biosynthesis glycosyl transferase WcaI